LKFTKDAFSACQENELKDILMFIVTAGGDVYAADEQGTTVSRAACQHGHEELWREVLGECDYNPDEVFSLQCSRYRNNYCLGQVIFRERPLHPTIVLVVGMRGQF
jgi:hypothetical protein